MRDDRPDLELDDIKDEIQLPCDFRKAIELWIAWTQHGIMPRAGGYLDQPRWWLQLVRLFTSRHTPIHQQYIAEKYPDKSQGDDKQYEGDMPLVNGWDGLGNWITSSD